MPLPFHKMHANGDDFVIVDARKMANPVTSALARRMGDRNRGIGFNNWRWCLIATMPMRDWNSGMPTAPRWMSVAAQPGVPQTD